MVGSGQVGSELDWMVRGVPRAGRPAPAVETRRSSKPGLPEPLSGARPSQLFYLDSWPQLRRSEGGVIEEILRWCEWGVGGQVRDFLGKVSPADKEGVGV